MSSLRRWLLKASIPIQKFMQLLHPPDSLVTAQFALVLVTHIKTGDVLLSRENWHFTNMFIPGYWSHAAIYAGGEVFESVGGGVRSQNIYEWLFNKDFVLVLRPQFFIDKSQIVERALAQVGKPYDYEFRSEIDTFYCSELVWYCLSNPVFEMRETFGVLTVTPQDFANATAKFSVVLDSRNKV
jgi:uncharacterized protein YycO